MPERFSRRAGSWLVAGLLVVGVVIGTLLFPSDRSDVPWPSTGLVTVTGFARLSPSSPSSGPTSVVLTSSQVKSLDDLISGLPKSSPPDCMENSVVFTIAYASRAGQPSKIDATDWECPAPGVLSLRNSSGSHQWRGDACRLKTFIDQTFSGGEAAGSKLELQQTCR
jgi:hypothetical protein